MLADDPLHKSANDHNHNNSFSTDSSWKLYGCEYKVKEIAFRENMSILVAVILRHKGFVRIATTIVRSDNKRAQQRVISKVVIRIKHALMTPDVQILVQGIFLNLNFCKNKSFNCTKVYASI